MDKETQERLLDSVKKMQEKFKGNLVERAEDVLQHWQAARELPEDEARQKDLYRHVHSLAGSSGTFGFPEVGDAARHALNAIKDWQAKENKLSQLDDIAEIEKRLDAFSSLVKSQTE